MPKMTREQLEILQRNTEGALADHYVIIGMEYPSRPYNWRAGDGECLKITAKVWDALRQQHVRYSDWIAENGSTVDTQEMVA